MLKAFAKGVYEALEQKQPGLFTETEIEEYVQQLFYSVVNKCFVFIGILVVGIFLQSKGMNGVSFIQTAVIFWLAWVMSTSVIGRFIKEVSRRSDKQNL